MFTKSLLVTLAAMLLGGSSMLTGRTLPMTMMVMQATGSTGTTASDTASTDTASTDTASTDTTATFPPPNQLAYTVEKRSAPLTAHGNFPNALKVTVKTRETPARAVPDVHIKGTIRSGEGAQIYSETTKGSEVIVRTDTAGVASFGILTADATEVEVQITPMSADEQTEFANVVEIETLSGSPRFVSSLGSKRSYLQLFIGQTFSMDYEADPTSTQGENNSVGFRNAGPIIRLTFDTMWARQKLSKRAREEQTDDRLHSMRHGLWHTDANLEFSRFPFGKDAAPADPNDPDPASEVGLENAFSGSFGLTWQPNRFASYDQRDIDDLTAIEKVEFPYDAYRWGFFGKMGVTTRAKSEPGGNTSVNRIQFGVRFTHGRSRNSSPVLEDRNEIPVRFVEISYGRFSDWSSGNTRQDSASRLVIDAGLRINALSNEVFPIYVGGHLNSGPGEDDLRVFLGMLVKLDLLGRLVQGVVPAPE